MTKDFVSSFTRLTMHLIRLLTLGLLVGASACGDGGLGDDLSVGQEVEQLQVVINEVGVSGRDWLELHNVSAADVDLGGWIVTDNLGNAAHHYMLGEGTVVKPGEYLVILKGDQEKGEPGFSYGIKPGETVYLLDPEKSVVEQVIVGEVEGDNSWGRYPDATGDWRMTEPTPGVVNGLPDMTAVPGKAGDKVFDDSKVHTITIEMSDVDWQKIIALADAYENVNAKFPYFEASMTFDGVALESKVGVRLKGHISIPLTNGESYPLKVDLNKFDGKQSLDGLKKLNLNTNFNGPILPIVRDFISYEAWRQFGVAAARTAFTRVIVNGKELGIYVMVEQVDGGFIKRNFNEPYGQLYKPEQQSGMLDYKGPLIENYPEINHKWPDEADHTALLNAIEILNTSSPGKIGEVFDVHGAFTYLAGNVALSSWDSYPITGHNYYLYEAAPGQFTMLPWDMNGSLEPSDVSVCNPWQGLLSSRLLEDPANEALYFELLDQFLNTVASNPSLLARLAKAQELIGYAFPKEEFEELKHQIETRSHLIKEELANTIMCHPE